MRRKTFVAVTTLALLAVPVVAFAQEEEKETPRSYIYGTYFECDPSQEWLADGIAEVLWKPAYDAAVEDGTISAWGWLAHHTGGKWRRVIYMSAPGLDALLDAQEKLREKIRETNADAAGEIGRICPAHDDYIWQDVVGAGSEDGRGEAGFSVYHLCEMSEEDRADEIVKEVMAPIYNRHLAEGTIESWGWAQHIVGGKWRRLATMTAADHKTLLAARAKIIAELDEKQKEALAEFSEICSSHQDYMWNVQLEKP